MKAAVWYNEKDIRVEETELKELKANEVTVKVAWAGICGSDLHEYVEGPVFIPVEENDDLTGQKAPLTMGHEFSGVIEKIGADVTDFKVGDRVSINPTLTYGNKPESVDVYDGFSFVGLHGDGGFADYANVPVSTLYKLPETMSLKQAALIEPTAVAVQAIKETGLRFGDNIAIFGAGPIGLLTVAAAKAAGASKIIVADLSQVRLDKAMEMGATHTINSGEVNAVEAIRKIVPVGVDVAIEVAGVEITVKQAIDVTRPRGTMVITSIFANPISWHPMQLINSGVKVSSSIAYSPTTFQQTINLMGTNQLVNNPVITKEIELVDIVSEGFETLVNDKSQAKILVKLSGAE